MTNEDHQPKPKQTFTPIQGQPVALPTRNLTEETCGKWDYRVATHKGKPVQVATYRDSNGTIVGQKLRYANKEFTAIGAVQDYLYGQNLWRDGGKMVVVTEGEIDALSVSQIQSHKWPVVSVPNGASGAVRAIRKNIGWLDKFETVVFMFDMDEPGREAASACAAILKPGKAKIASLPMKDPNEMLVAGRGAEIVGCIWGAKEWRPDGIVSVNSVIEKAKQPPPTGLDWPWPSLTKYTYGRRSKELYGLGGGTAAGKTDVFTTILAHCIGHHKETVGAIYMEQATVETTVRVAGKMAGRTFHIPDSGWTQEEKEVALNSIKDKLWLYDHFGSQNWENIRGLIRYMAISLGVKFIVLDHLTALAAHAEDQRRSLDGIMADLGGDVQNLDISILFASHLVTPVGTAHEEGGVISANQFIGSRAIMQWATFLIGLERNQQAEEKKERNTATVRILKDRLTGQSTGETFKLMYEAETGLLKEPTEAFPFQAPQLPLTSNDIKTDF